MKNFTHLAAALFAALTFAACSSGEKEAAQQLAAQPTDSTVHPKVPRVLDGQQWLKIDLQQDLSGKSLQELRLLRSALQARQGYLFMEADLRGYFTAHTTWYDSLMTARWNAEESGENTFPIIGYSTQEQAFLDKIKALEARKLAQNYRDVNGANLANADNIINLFQFKRLPPEFLAKLRSNNFVIVPNNNVQLFHVYEQNDYQQLPNFVTTDLYLQLYHMYFSYLLKSLEQEKFIPILVELTDGLYAEATKAGASSADPEVKALADFTAVFYAIPYYLLTGAKKKLSAPYQALFEAEVQKINAAEDDTPSLLDSKEAYFAYSLFKPRGHYTRKPALQQYFKAMMWLQTATFCREKEHLLLQAGFSAFLLNSGKAKSGKKLADLYTALYEPITFLIGEPDNLSIQHIQAFLKSSAIARIEQILEPATRSKLNSYLLALAGTHNRIKPKIEVTCPDKINFMPQRYLLDNEVLQEMVDVRANATRAYPKGLDVFASLGDKAATNTLVNTHQEESNWDAFTPQLSKLKKKFEGYRNWDQSVYNKWMESLVVMQQPSAGYPTFMQTPAWEKKNLNTALASWAELKHDAILYGEQPMAAECGGGGPPDPITVGYVEPNVHFWQKMLELNQLTEKLLARHQLLTEDISEKTAKVKENVAFLLSASQKELKKQKLSEQEYKAIEIIGSTFEYLTLSIVEPEKYLPFWENVQGPDKSVAVVADIYTRNVAGCAKNGILHVATGKVNDLYVVVEIEGYLYLTKGAVFSYYEFVRRPGQRLTDEEWQKILETKEVPPVPAWMEDILLPSKEKPVVNEKIFYSSGC